VPAVSAPSAELRKDAVSVEMLESLGLGSAQVNLLNAIASELSKIPGVIAVVLGGSYARRAARPDSDLDVGLYYSKNSPPDIEAIRRCAETISVPNSPPNRCGLLQVGTLDQWRRVDSKSGGKAGPFVP
jgi:hypothetical protein